MKPSDLRKKRVTQHRVALKIDMVHVTILKLA